MTLNPIKKVKDYKTTISVESWREGIICGLRSVLFSFFAFSNSVLSKLLLKPASKILPD